MAKFNQRLADLAPADPTWRLAPPALHLAFHREAGRVAVEVKRGELARGIGANGRRMLPRRSPRPDGATGPVLTPHEAKSRTARLLAAHSDLGGVTLFWRSGHSGSQRLPWGTILGFHARGEVRGAPVRDVRLSKRGVNAVRDRMARWWQAHHAGELRQRERARLAAEAQTRRRRPGVVQTAQRAVAAMVERYPSLKPYLQPKRGGSP